MTTTKKIGITLRHAPYGNDLSQEALDATLAMGLFRQEITLFFLGDGIFQLLKNQSSDDVYQKSLEKQINAFELYDIERIFVCAQSLEQRNIATSSLCTNVVCLSPTEIQEVLSTQDTLLSF